MLKSLTISVLCWLMTPVATLSCGTERWPVKTLATADVSKINATPVFANVADLAAIEAPTRKELMQRETSRFPMELRTFRVQGFLVGFKKETDEDFHIVIADLTKPETMVVEMPAPACVPEALSKEFADMRESWEARFGRATAKFKMVQRHHIRVEFTGPAFFDFIHGQTGVAKNGIEIHPPRAWREVFPRPDGDEGTQDASLHCVGQCGHKDRACQNRCLDRQFCPAEDSL